MLIRMKLSGAGMLFVALLTLGIGTCRAPACEAPHYFKGVVWDDSDSSIEMNVSIRLSDLGPDRLLCLAKAIERRYRDRSRVSIFIFSSREAAEKYFPFPGVADYYFEGPEGARQMQASYMRDPAKQINHLHIMPLGSDVEGPYDYWIHLPIMTPPQCPLQINRRCLVKLDEIKNPGRASRLKAFGVITLTGTITQDGSMKSIQVVASDIKPSSEAESVLLNDARTNLESWRFAAGRHRDIARITYRYILDPSLPSSLPVVEIASPSEVVIRANPGD